MTSGPAAVTIRAISAAVGVSNGALYHTFGSRSGLMGRAWLRAGRRFLSCAKRAGRSGAVGDRPAGTECCSDRRRRCAGGVRRAVSGLLESAVGGVARGAAGFGSAGRRRRRAERAPPIAGRLDDPARGQPLGPQRRACRRHDHHLHRRLTDRHRVAPRPMGRSNRPSAPAGSGTCGPRRGTTASEERENIVGHQPELRRQDCRSGPRRRREPFLARVSRRDRRPPRRVGRLGRPGAGDHRRRQVLLQRSGSGLADRARRSDDLVRRAGAGHAGPIPHPADSDRRPRWSATHSAREQCWRWRTTFG